MALETVNIITIIIILTITSVAVIVIVSSVRPTEACHGYYKTVSIISDVFLKFVFFLPIFLAIF
jgi:hypothetical protein